MGLLPGSAAQDLLMYLAQCRTEAHLPCRSPTPGLSRLYLELLVVDIFAESDCDQSESIDAFEGGSDVDSVGSVRLHLLVPFREDILSFSL